MEKQKKERKVWLYGFVFLMFGLVLGLIIFNSGISGNAIFNIKNPFQPAPVVTPTTTAVMPSIEPPVTYAGVLSMLNTCNYFAGTLINKQSCNTICSNPSLWNQSENPGTCVNMQFINENDSYNKQLNRCGFAENGRNVLCVCCSAPEDDTTPEWETESCYDSDGNNTYTLGQVEYKPAGPLTTPTTAYTDYCLSNTQVTEFICAGTVVSKFAATCKYGCYKGACRKYPVVANQATA